MNESDKIPEKPVSENELLILAAENIRKRLPSAWSVDIERGESSVKFDSCFRIKESSGDSVLLPVEVRRSLVGRDIPIIKERFSLRSKNYDRDSGIVVGRYLSPEMRKQLGAHGLSFIDATGNIDVRASSPALFIADRGADRDPWRGPGRPRGTLKGEPAARVVRALLDLPDPWQIRELIDASGSSTGSVYRVIRFLEEEALVVRNKNGMITVPSKEALLRRWSADYQFLSSNSVTKWIAPRGVESFLKLVSTGNYRDYAITGSAAADTWVEVAPTRAVFMYCSDPQRAAQEWKLHSTDTGVNVLLAQPTYKVVTERAFVREDGVVIVAAAQAATDLLTGPGRSSAEAEALIEWMKKYDRI